MRRGRRRFLGSTRVTSQAPASASPPAASAEAWRARGAQLQAEGRHAEALEIFRARAERISRRGAWLSRRRDFAARARRRRAALQAASEACWRAPDMPEAHYAYGQAFAALGAPARAEQAFARAIQLKPRWADAWVNYGVALYAQGRIEDAKTAMRKALAADPSHAASGVQSRRLHAHFRRSGGRRGASANACRAQFRGRRGAAQPRRRPLAGGASRGGARFAAGDRPARRLPRRRARWRLSSVAGAAAIKSRRARRAHRLRRWGPVPPALEPLLRWRYVLIALAEGDIFARAKRGRSDGGGARKTWGLRPSPNTRSWRATIWPNSGRCRTRPRARWRNGPKATSCWQNSSRFRARRTAPSSTPPSPRSARSGCTTAPRAQQPRSGAGLHRRHAALGHDARRADPRRASRCLRRRRTRRAGGAFSRARRRKRRGGRSATSPRSEACELDRAAEKYLGADACACAR